MSGTRQLLSAIRSRNIGKMSKLLGNMDLDEVNGKQDGDTALHFACRRNYNEAVDLLVAKNGIDVNLKNYSGKTPLHVAICSNNGHAVAKILTNPQVNVNVQDNSGRTPLHFACSFNHHQIVSELLGSPGVDVNVRGRDGLTPVMMSARGYSEETLKLLLEDTRVDVDAKDVDGGGLEVHVEGGWGDSKKKEKCLEMIINERRKRENSKLEQEQPNQDGNIEQQIEKLEKLKEMGDLEKKLKENLAIRKQKKSDLNERQSVEKTMIATKYNEVEAALKRKLEEEEETTMKKRHKGEEIILETMFVREDEVEQLNMALLRERRDELALDIQKLTNDPVQDTSEDRSKVEAAEKALECPVCTELMRPPTKIWMCRLSHIICESCKDGVDKNEYNQGICPTCMSGRVTQRAVMAENFARAIFKE